MTATSPATPPVPRAALADLADRIAGRLLTAHDPGYRQAIDVFNAAIDHCPDYVVQPPAPPMSSRRCASPASTNSAYQ